MGGDPVSGRLCPAWVARWPGLTYTDRQPFTFTFPGEGILKMNILDVFVCACVFCVPLLCVLGDILVDFCKIRPLTEESHSCFIRICWLFYCLLPGGFGCSVPLCASSSVCCFHRRRSLCFPSCFFSIFSASSCLMWSVLHLSFSLCSIILYFIHC